MLLAGLRIYRFFPDNVLIWLIFTFDPPLFNKVTISPLWLLKICMFFPPPGYFCCLSQYFLCIQCICFWRLPMKEVWQITILQIYGTCFIWYLCETHPSNGFFLFFLGSLLYEQLGMKAFGMAGKLAASGSITMQNIGGEDKILKCLRCQ